MILGSNLLFLDFTENGLLHWVSSEAWIVVNDEMTLSPGKSHVVAECAL